MNVVKDEILTNKNKALALYKYLKEFCALDVKVIANVDSYIWKLFFSEIPEDSENIKVAYKDRVKDNDEDVDDNRCELLSIRKPQFDKCPEPPKEIKEWLLPGWDNYIQKPQIKNLEKFKTDSKRCENAAKWLKSRNFWKEKQEKIKITRDFFNKLYKIHVDLNDDNETKELVVANGFISCADNTMINHPILTKKVYTDFNPKDNIISIYDSDSESELDISLLTSIPGININVINEADEEIQDKFYHPLDRHETYDFFKNFVHKLSSKGKFLNVNEQPLPNTDDKIFISVNPIYYVRNKIDGTRRVIEDIINDIENNGTIPTHLCELISGGKVEIPEDVHELTIDEQLAETSGESVEVLLSKESSVHIKKKIQEAESARKATIDKLALIRKKIFAIRNSEYKLISYGGESYSPSDIAKFINENNNSLSYIPGEIAKNMLLPLTRDELLTLYESNTQLSEHEEKELNLDIINPNKLLNPQDFNNFVNTIDNCIEQIKQIKTFLASKGENILFVNDEQTTSIKIKKTNGMIAPLITNPNVLIVKKLQEFLLQFNTLDEWMIYAAVDGKKGAGYKKCWLDLINQISNTVNLSESFVNERFGKEVSFSDDIKYNEVLTTLEKMEIRLKRNGKLSFWDNLLDKHFKEIKEKIKINNEPISTGEDCSLVIKIINLEKMRRMLCIQWNNLIGRHNYKKFEELDSNEPEQIAQNFIPKIKQYIDWYNNDYKILLKYLTEFGFNYKEVIKSDDLDSDIVSTKKIFEFTSQILPKYLELIKICDDLNNAKISISSNKTEVLTHERKKSELCNNLANAIQNRDKDNYLKFYNDISSLYNKTNLKQQREQLLEKLKQYAPDWAYKIQHRDGIYGENKIPVNISEAWKYKQFKNIIKELHSDNYEKLQKDCFNLSNLLKKQTAQLCEYKAWYHLLQTTEKDLDIKQALTGWKTMIKKIGKGTGKNVPRYLKEAKALMVKCQKAVPAWIMPMSKALETLTPGKNKFDVIIIDEASQSNISALAIVYMAKKIIIVGDDKQVSPTAGFKEISKINNLIDIHLNGVIPNPQVYEASTSLYDIAETTFTSLMLKEHFRCVPDIINFSNGLSYDYKIKPLRDASSSNVQPAVINYRVDGTRKTSNKVNLEEANCIASLIAACIEREEYKDSTFGVISLLGTEQAKIIKDILLDKIDNIKYEHHKIACGEPPNFQGDERDIIFLSMVDSNDSESPLKIMNADGDRKRRYNVAVSRAKNQVWLVHSLDVTKDLKEDDIRRKLIEYTMNPRSYSQRLKQIQQQSDSLFEQEICKSLVARGYNIIQQFPVSSYRIDMVACCGNKKVAIECDGEKFHSGEEKIREDMERQNIIERITKFKFIRIRGSEYNLDKNKAIERIIRELNEYEIYPENSQEVLNSENLVYPSLIEDIKIRAQQIREEWKIAEQNISINNNTIENYQAKLF